MSVKKEKEKKRRGRSSINGTRKQVLKSERISQLFEEAPKDIHTRTFHSSGALRGEGRSSAARPSSIVIRLN